MKLVFFLFSIFSSAQVLHHQSIASQGCIFVSAKNIHINQSIGQQSIAGTSKYKGYVVQQGFQQSNWSKILEQNTISISTVVYPNPFKDILKFSFSKSPGNVIGMVVFDLVGRLVYSEEVKNDANFISVNLNNLPSAEYYVKLTAKNYIFSTKVLKQ